MFGNRNVIRVDFLLTSGTPHSKTVSWQDDSGSPQSLVGYDVYWTFVLDGNILTKYNDQLQIDRPNGVVTVSLSGAEVSAIVDNAVVWGTHRLLAISPTGSHFRMAQGIVGPPNYEYDFAVGGNNLFDQQIFVTDGTWYKPDWAGPSSLVEVYAIGGGGSGGSGRRGAAGTARGGGGGGGGGAFCWAFFPANTLTDTVAVTVGPPAVGGAAIEVDSTNGNSGNSGSDVFFGNYINSMGGLGGGAGTAGAGGGGGGVVGGVQHRGTGGGAGSNGSAAGGNGTTSISGADGGPTGGGGGGGINTSNTNLAAGEPGFIFTHPQDLSAYVSGSNGVESLSGYHPGTGGFGGSLIDGSNNGGAGALGGGGGGGGASLNGNLSGTGGPGGRGAIIVIVRGDG